MLTLKEWMELVDYKITEGSDYYVNVEGLYLLSSWNGEQDGYSFDIAFDPKDDQRVYMVEAHDYQNGRAYRLRDPELEADMNAWDDVNYVELENDDDFVQKCLAIKAGENYDTRVSVPLTVPDDVLFELMKQAHEKDITLNQLVEDVIRDAIVREEGDMGDDEFDQGTWDDLAEDHWDDDGDEMPSDVQDLKPAATIKAKKKKKSK